MRRLDVKKIKCDRDDLYQITIEKRKGEKELSHLQLFHDFGKVTRSSFLLNNLKKLCALILILNKYSLNTSPAGICCIQLHLFSSRDKFAEDQSRHFERFHPRAKLKLPHLGSRSRLSFSLFLSGLFSNRRENKRNLLYESSPAPV